MAKHILPAEDDRFLRRGCETKLKQRGLTLQEMCDRVERLMQEPSA
jgi:hypothetical protein